MQFMAALKHQYYWMKSIGQGPLWEADSFSVCQEIFPIFMERNVSQMTQFHIHTSYLYDSAHLLLGLSRDLFLVDYKNKLKQKINENKHLYAFLITTLRVRFVLSLLINGILTECSISFSSVDTEVFVRVITLWTHMSKQAEYS